MQSYPWCVFGTGHREIYWFSNRKAERWATRPDDEVIGSVLSPACHVDQAFPAALYLTWKYHDQFDTGIIANAMVGVDNCHRGAVVGSILAGANGIHDRWTAGLKAYRETSTAL